jgi:hypothetical protein
VTGEEEGAEFFERGDHAPGTDYADVADLDGCVLEIDQRVRKGRDAHARSVGTIESG